MRLKRLTLQGYKTFATKTEFVFDGGITAVIGPNGSGKSNIADAIRWVLGEQSYSMLRGKRTTDMIFAGSHNRPRAGMAQAIIALDNSNGWLPIDYGEIEIARRAYRSGENEYLLNGQKVRLRDVTELLSDSGLAERTYTIIGQGLIDKALSLRAEERRLLFEEAAGVSHYKNKRAVTVQRLQETQRNLERVHDILSEIKPRLNSLRRQASRANNYEQVAADLRHYLRMWYGYRWEQARRGLRQSRLEAEEARQAWQEARRQQVGHDSQVGAERGRLSALQRLISEKNRGRNQVREKLERERRQVAILGERRDLLGQQLTEYEVDMPGLRSRRSAARQELDRAMADLQSAQAELDEKDTASKQFETSFQAQQAEIDSRQGELDDVETRRESGRERLAKLKAQRYHLRLQLKDKQTAFQDDGSIEEAEQESQGYESLLRDALSDLDTLRRKRESIQQERRLIISNILEALPEVQRKALQPELSELERLDGAEHRLAQKEEKSRRLLATVQGTFEQSKEQFERQIARREAIAAEIERYGEQIAASEKEIERLESELNTLDDTFEAAKEALYALPLAEAGANRRTLQQQIETARTIVAGRQAVVDSRRATLNQVEDQLRRRGERLGQIRSQLEELDLSSHETKSGEFEKELSALDKALQPLAQELEEINAGLSKIEKALSASHRVVHEFESAYAEARITLSQRENEVEGLRERIQADIGLVVLSYDDDQTSQTPLPMADVVEQLPEVAELPEDIEETILRYRGRLSRMGSVNQEAPAEYEETKERYEFLLQQVEDLSNAEVQLRNVMEELDDLTSRAFADTVVKVDEVFGNVFERLFGGGSAQLVLTDPDDLNVSGVDIVARLPRRREQGLALLSGGERSLTAAALIFSLLKVSPTPFCVLDEVDAMLDESNIGRFRDLLRELSLKTQFIVITHNQRTVEVAETVYGISVGADSASRVIAVKPANYVGENSPEQTKNATPGRFGSR
jgi:chromosome segregation protein